MTIYITTRSLSHAFASGARLRIVAQSSGRMRGGDLPCRHGDRCGGRAQTEQAWIFSKHPPRKRGLGDVLNGDVFSPGKRRLSFRGIIR
jgi:hypothetical protein